MYEFVCEQCRQPFSAKGRNRRFCSKRCHNAMQLEFGHEVRDMSAEERAYLAGLIDGEGTVIVHDRRGRGRPNATRPQVILGICGASLAMHDWVSRTTEVGRWHLMPESASAVVKRNSDVFQWRVIGNTAIGVLRQTLPYMVEKRPRAEFAINCHEQGFAYFDGGAHPSGARFIG